MGAKPGQMKRVAQHVPDSVRRQLNRLSKADLMEVAYSFGLRLEGEENAETVPGAIKREYETLCANQGRKPVKL